MKTAVTELPGTRLPVVQSGMMLAGRAGTGMELMNDIPACEELLIRMVAECRNHLQQAMACVEN